MLSQTLQRKEVEINVSEINVIAVQGEISMTISQATAGQAPDAATDAGTYALTTNGTKKKITAELDEDMPTGFDVECEHGAHHPVLILKAKNHFQMKQ